MATSGSKLTEVDVYWNGVAVDETVDGVTRSLADFPIIGPTPVEPVLERLADSIVIERGDPVVGAVEVAFRIEGQSAESTDATRVRDLMDDWEAMGLRYNPFGGELWLRVDRKDDSNAAVSRQLACRVLDLPTCAHVERLADLGAPGLYVDGAGGPGTRYYYPVRMRAEYGLWRKREAKTLTIAGADATGEIGNVVNDGVTAIGCKVTFSNKSGTVNTLTLAGTGITTVTFTSPANTHYWDHHHTTRGDSAGTATVNVGYDLRLPIGTTAITATAAGGGTIDVEIAYFPYYGSW